MYKYELCNLYNEAGQPMTMTTLKRLLNERYFSILSAVGYRKTDKLLSPLVIAKFYEIYGKPVIE